jgi:hypothetical protein
MKSHNYHVLLTQMIVIGLWNILLVSVQEAKINFCFFFNAIGQKVLREEPLETLEKSIMTLYAFLRCIFHLPFLTSAFISQLILLMR